MVIKQYFKVIGITCKNCIRDISRSLKISSDIIKFNIDEKTHTLEIHSRNILDKKNIQGLLNEKFSLVDHDFDKQNSFNNVKLTALFPLILILSFIIISSILLNIDNFKIENLMFDYMGLFFIVFSFFKFLDLKSFVIAFKKYDPICKQFFYYGYTYPFVELALGGLFLFRLYTLLCLITTIIILTATTYGVVKSLKRKENIECACLGGVLKLPLTEATLIENIVMVTMAMSLIVFN